MAYIQLSIFVDYVYTLSLPFLFNLWLPLHLSFVNSLMEISNSKSSPTIYQYHVVHVEQKQLTKLNLIGSH